MRGERAQTAHDFALGMGVFLLAVAFTFSALPTVGAAFDDGPASGGAPDAERVAATTIHHLSADGERASLDPDRTATFFRNRSSGEALGRFFGLPDRSTVGVSIRNGSGVVHLTARDGTDVPLAAGTGATDRPSARWVRIVSFDGAEACQPACRLVVRVG